MKDFGGFWAYFEEIVTDSSILLEFWREENHAMLPGFPSLCLLERSKPAKSGLE